MASIIKTENLTHIYSVGTPFEKIAIKDINLEISSGEFIGIVGHTGSGKSTLIQHLNGLLKPTSGTINIDGTDINSSKANLRNARFSVGLVFQYPEYQLFDETVAKDIAFGPRNMGLSETEIEERVAEAAGFAGLTGELLEKSPFELSGGQKRRAAIAGVIAMRPKVLILDEPTAGLDPIGCDEILEQVNNYRLSTGAAVVMVSHSMEEIASWSERIIVMSHGSVAMDGTPREVFSRAEEIKSLGLKLPEVTKILLRLKELGVPVDTAVYTREQAVRAICALKGGAYRA